MHATETTPALPPHAALSESDQAEAAEPGPAPRLEVTVDAELEDSPDWVPWLGEQTRRVAALTGVRRGRVAVAVIDDARMAELHEQYKGVPGTTDVLTFDLRDMGDPERAPDEANEAIDADVAVCIDEARRQSAARGHEVRIELLLYVTHALLHLTGYDDDTDEGAAAMHAREDELLTAAGFGAVYGSTALR